MLAAFLARGAGTSVADTMQFVPAVDSVARKRRPVLVVALVDAAIEEDSAIVRVYVSSIHTRGGPPGGARQQFFTVLSYRLRRVEREWRVVERRLDYAT